MNRAHVIFSFAFLFASIASAKAYWTPEALPKQDYSKLKAYGTHDPRTLQAIADRSARMRELPPSPPVSGVRTETDPRPAGKSRIAKARKRARYAKQVSPRGLVSENPEQLLAARAGAAR